MPFLDVELNRDVLEFGFDGAEVFYEWCWSHGWRNVMEPLTDEQLKVYRRGVFESIGDFPITGRDPNIELVSVNPQIVPAVGAVARVWVVLHSGS